MGYLDTLRGSADLQKLSVEQLEEVAAEIREAIIGQVSSSGGHLAPNLGVVELTLALHYVFDFSFDRLLFDVGHQCYPHKLITGRAGKLSGLRTSKGISGFPEPMESEYDLFRVGHAGTGVSTAVGMARGDQLSGEGFDPETNVDGRRVVSLVGDASIVNGVSMEGLNNAGTLKRQMLVILNDNGMSISKPQGALAGYFDRVRVSHTYTDMKKAGKSLLSGLPGGSVLREAAHRAGEMTKALVSEDSWFDKFGLLTVGPIDGHDLPTLIEFLAEARDIDRPMVLHVKTVKGKGLEYAEKDATTFHSPAAHTYDKDSCRVELKASGRSFTKAFADAMTDVMARDEKAVACTAAMPGGTGIDKVIAEFPERSWDVGICESHGMDMMAGLAKTGFKPFFAVYSTFLQRAFDQAFQEVALQGLPVRICLDRAGLVGGDGSVHHGFCDVAILRTLPGSAILAVMDEPSLIASLEFMRTYEEGLSAVRYPRDSVSGRFADEECPAFELGKARLLTPAFADLDAERPDVAVLAYGTTAIAAMDAADELGDEYRVAVWDGRFAKPVDDAMVRDVLSRGIPVVTVEDHSVVGGFGTSVLESAAEQGLDASRVRRLGIPDAWIHQDSRGDQLRLAGIDAAGIAAAVRGVVAEAADVPTDSPTVEVEPTRRDADRPSAART
ncbi:MAG: 1-deoxy-D-xylulose-5-phosphate synthase [Planctomycetota bacterium]